MRPAPWSDLTCRGVGNQQLLEQAEPPAFTKLLSDEDETNSHKPPKALACRGFSPKGQTNP